jgi:3-oxoacyl-[acyl-carrier-protein] synthase-3
MRQYLQKSSSFANVWEAELARIAYLLNTRPRNFKTPWEAQYAVGQPQPLRHLLINPPNIKVYSVSPTFDTDVFNYSQSDECASIEPDELERPKSFRPLRLVASGEALPYERVSAEALDAKLKLPLGWTAEHTGVLERRYASSSDTAAALGAKAAQVALAKAQLRLADIDAVVCASGGMQQSIPCTAALISEELKGQGTGIPCFDINATCLSFVVALDTLANALVLGRYRRILLVSTEITSRHLNWQDPESCCLFGDGAVAFVIEPGDATATQGILGTSFRTYCEGAHWAEIQGGGSLLPPETYRPDRDAAYRFAMQGNVLFKQASKWLPSVVADCLNEAQCSLESMALVVPHQASLPALRLTQKRLRISDAKFFYDIAHYGNVVATSIPLALHHAIEQGRLQRGQKVLLLGTSAGLSIGALCLNY